MPPLPSLDLLAKAAAKVDEEHHATLVRMVANGARALSHKPRVGIWGRYSSGKSSLINALLGEKVLPAYHAKATTPVATLITHRPQRRFVIVADVNTIPLWGDARPYRGTDDLASCLDQTKGGAPNNPVVVGHPSSFLKTLDIVDTPGFDNPGAEREVHEQHAKTALADAAVLVLVLRANEMDEHSMDLLQDLLIGRRPVVVVLNATDQLDADDVQTVLATTRRYLRERCGIREPLVFPVSALWELTPADQRVSTDFIWLDEEGEPVHDLDGLRSTLLRLARPDWPRTAAAVLAAGELIERLTATEDARRRQVLTGDVLLRHFDALARQVRQLPPEKQSFVRFAMRRDRHKTERQPHQTFEGLTGLLHQNQIVLPEDDVAKRRLALLRSALGKETPPLALELAERGYLHAAGNCLSACLRSGVSLDTPAAARAGWLAEFAGQAWRYERALAQVREDRITLLGQPTALRTRLAEALKDLSSVPELLS